MTGKVKCTCGWSWNKSDSSKKDMYICHECGRDNSNNMKNGGWLDSYANGGTMQENQENYNDESISLPEGFVGMGNNIQGRDYSPAWGGQFQNGGEMKYYQEGLDFQPKGMEDGGWLDGYAQDGKFVPVGKPVGQLQNVKGPGPGTMRQTESQSLKGKVWDTLVNPVTALEQVVKTGRIPDNMGKAIDAGHIKENALELPMDFINPFQGVDALAGIPGELGRGEYLNAGLSFLDALDLGVYAKGAMKASKPFLQKVGQQLGNISTSITPELRQGLKTAGIAENLTSSLKSGVKKGGEFITDAMNKKIGPEFSRRILPDDIEPFAEDLGFMNKMVGFKKVGSTASPDVDNVLGYLNLHKRTNTVFNPATQLFENANPEWFKPGMIEVKKNMQGHQMQDALYQLGIDEAKKQGLKGVVSGEQLLSPAKTAKAHQRFEKEIFESRTTNGIDHDIAGLTQHMNPNVVADFMEKYKSLPKHVQQKYSLKEYIQMSGKAMSDLASKELSLGTTAAVLGVPIGGIAGTLGYSMYESGKQLDEMNALHARMQEETDKQRQEEANRLIQENKTQTTKYYEGGIIKDDRGQYDNDIPKAQRGKEIKRTDETSKAVKRGFEKTEKPANWIEENFNKALSAITPDYESVEDREKLFKRYRPVDYPNVGSALNSLIKGSQLPERDIEGDLNIGEEAWRKALNLPGKEKYIIPSAYKPTTSKDPNAKYYTLNNIIDKEKILAEAKKLGIKPGQKINLESMAPYIKEGFMDVDKFSNIDPLQKFQINMDPEGKYVSIYDKYDFDFMPANKTITPYEFYDRFYLNDKDIPKAKLLPGNKKQNKKDGGWLEKYQNGDPIKKDNTNVRQPLIKQMKTYSAEEGEAANRRAYELSSRQALLETAKEDVQKNFDEVSNSFLWNLPGSISPMAAEDLIIGGVGKGLKYLKGSKIGKQVVNKASDFVSDINIYPTQKQAVQYRADRMLEQENKWIGQNNNELTKKFNNSAINHQDNLTALEWNKRHGDIKSPESLGVNKFGETVVYKDANLSFANKSRVSAHEAGHYYRNTFDEGKNWGSYFDFSRIKQKTADYLRGKGMKNRGSIYGDEIRERAAQLKDYIAHKNEIPLNKDFKVTQAQLDDALENYVKDTNLDNSMSDMIVALKDKKGFLKAINKYALAAPIGLGTVLANENENSFREGGVIKDDRGQWDHPGEITEIGSNQITMQGVPYPVLGISDTGDIQMMYPDEEYQYDGKSVTEYPMAKNGIRQEQKGLVNLDQLTNFTNYNKPQPGGWLNKYN